MKTKLLVTAFFLINVIIAFSQDTTMLHEGNLSYILSDGRYIEKYNINKPKKQSYLDVRVEFPFPMEKPEEFYKILRTVFSEERAKELATYNCPLACTFHFNGITKTLDHMSFFCKNCNVCDENEKNKFPLPVTLSELDKIEAAFKALNYKYKVIVNMETDNFTHYGFYIRFNKMYSDNN